MNRRNGLLAIAAALALCGWAGAEVQPKDAVYYGLKVTSRRGRIAKVSPAEITLAPDGSGREWKIAVNEVVKVTFGQDPPELTHARNAALQGRLEDARASLAKIDLNTLSRAEVKQDVLYYRAFCAAKLAMDGKGDKKAAGSLLRGFINQNGESYHYFEAVELFGDLAFSAGEYQSAAEHYALLAKAPWEDYQMRAALAEGRALQARGDFAQALQRYDSVAGSGVKTPTAQRQKQLAAIGRAVCLAQTGKSDEAIKLLQQIIAENDPGDMVLFGRAYNALGACYVKAKQPKEALHAYLHVDLLFFGDPEAHAEALYHLSKLWSAANRSDRAICARNLLESRYAGSTWAERAKQP